MVLWIKDKKGFHKHREIIDNVGDAVKIIKANYHTAYEFMLAETATSRKKYYFINAQILPKKDLPIKIKDKLYWATDDDLFIYNQTYNTAEEYSRTVSLVDIY